MTLTVTGSLAITDLSVDLTATSPPADSISRYGVSELQKGE